MQFTTLQDLTTRSSTTAREGNHMRRSVHIGLSLLTVLVLLIATAGTSSAHQDGMHILKIKAAKGGKPHGTNNLFSHGGAIEQSAKVYIVYWGPQWQTGFSTG